MYKHSHVHKVLISVLVLVPQGQYLSTSIEQGEPFSITVLGYGARHIVNIYHNLILLNKKERTGRSLSKG